MNQPPNNELTKTPRATNGSTLPGGEKPAHAEPRAPMESGAVPPPANEIVRLSEGSVASASDESLTVIITEATCLAKEAQRELERRAAKREADFLDMVRQQALVLGVSPARLTAALAGKALPRTRAIGGSDGRSVVMPKYRDPADPTRTWSGRGNAPPWIELDPSTGKPFAKFHIPEDEE